MMPPMTPMTERSRITNDNQLVLWQMEMARLARPSRRFGLLRKWLAFRRPAETKRSMAPAALTRVAESASK